MDFDITIHRYVVKKVTVSGTIDIVSTSDKEIADNYYEAELEKIKDDTSHIVIYIYDYDKNTNIKYFDNQNGTY